MGRQSLQEPRGQGVSGELRGQGLPLGLSLCAPGCRVGAGRPSYTRRFTSVSTIDT